MKRSQNCRDQGFASYFSLMIEGSGSVPLTNGSGSGRPKKIRVCNTGIRSTVKLSCEQDSALYKSAGKIEEKLRSQVPVPCEKVTDAPSDQALSTAGLR
jgi:hypothetical protein